MRAALRHLCEKGVEALKPQKVVAKAKVFGDYMAKPARVVWRRPVVSKRVGNDLRKQAIRAGTYGSFDVATGVGWDPMWDLALKPHQYKVTRFGGIFPPKKTARERNREERAQKIEEKLETRLEVMEEYYAEKEEARIKDRSFESSFKRMSTSQGP